jgi:hypothetical protein
VGVGERSQPLKGGRASGEHDAAGLIRERYGHARTHHPAKRLDRVQLQLGEVVKPIQHHGRCAPQRGLAAQRVQRSGHVQFAVGAFDLHERLVVALIRLAHPLQRGPLLA